MLTPLGEMKKGRETHTHTRMEKTKQAGPFALDICSLHSLYFCNGLHFILLLLNCKLPPEEDSMEIS